MIKKKPYEKQENKTLYNNQQEMINRQGNFDNYGLDSEYWFSARTLDARRQARNIIPYQTISEFNHRYDGGEIYMKPPRGKYLVTWYWQTTGSGNVKVYKDSGYFLEISWNQISIPVEIEEWETFSIRPNTNTWTWTYNLIFISL